MYIRSKPILSEVNLVHEVRGLMHRIGSERCNICHKLAVHSARKSCIMEDDWNCFHNL